MTRLTIYQPTVNLQPTSAARPNVRAPSVRAPSVRAPSVLAKWLALGFAIAPCACIAGWEPPLWLQPSVIGQAWAGLFLCGVIITVSIRKRETHVWLARLQLLLLVLYIVGVRWMTVGLMSLTAAEANLLVASWLAAGWLTDCITSGTQELVVRNQNERQKLRQWSIWDIGVLMTIVAVGCYAVPRLETSSVLLTQIGLVALGGLLNSWIAWRWVLDDHWTVTKLLVAVGTLALCVWLISFRASTDQTVWQYLNWLLAGPLAVVAAQGASVLVVIAAIRADQHSRLRSLS